MAGKFQPNSASEGNKELAALCAVRQRRYSSVSEEKLVTELAKQLRIKDMYNDAVSPAAKQAGELAADIVKVIRLAPALVQVAAVLQERFRLTMSRSRRKQSWKRRDRGGQEAENRKGD
jgi:hypothetical protein